MCGIYGHVSTQDSAVDVESLNKISQFLAHRGPDESGRFTEGNVTLGMHRLSIVGTTNGHQPIWNSSNTVSIVANGEIYNYLELKESLQLLGYSFSTSSDVECLMHLYCEYGEDFLKDVRGMFAFAILDISKKKLILGRDRLGEKPLYYSELKSGFWFSSELSALLKSGISNYRISKEGLSLYLKYGFVPTPLTIVNGIKQLDPGTILTLDLQSLRYSTRCYWRLESLLSRENRDPIEDYRKELEIIGESIFQGDAPMGVALSGGMDSSLIATFAKKYGKNVTCITIGYGSKSDYDESRLAESFSKDIGFPCVIRTITIEEVGTRFQKSVAALNEPIADPTTFCYFILGEEANKLGIKVLLSGHGPDEIFYGYSWVAGLAKSFQRRSNTLAGQRRISEYLPLPRRPRRITLGQFLDHAKTGFGMIENFLQYREDSQDFIDNRNTMKFYSRKPRARERARIAKSLGLDFNKINDDMEHLGNSRLRSDVESMRIVLMKTYLQVNGLSQIDRLWMASSVEGRNLFVDFKLVEIALSDPKNSLLGSRDEVKSRFVEYIRPYLSAEILSRKKRGFTPPVADWTKEIYRRNRTELRNSKLVRDGILPKRAQRLLNRPLTVIGRPKLLWLELAVLEFWYRNIFFED
jgi:asparagine synthase (glutamine-hydrolysing)